MGAVRTSSVAEAEAAGAFKATYMVHREEQLKSVGTGADYQVVKKRKTRFCARGLGGRLVGEPGGASGVGEHSFGSGPGSARGGEPSGAGGVSGGSLGGRLVGEPGGAGGGPGGAGGGGSGAGLGGKLGG